MHVHDWLFFLFDVWVKVEYTLTDSHTLWGGGISNPRQMGGRGTGPNLITQCAWAWLIRLCMHSEETNYCNSTGPVCASETLWPFKSSLNVDAFVLRGRKQEKEIGALLWEWSKNPLLVNHILSARRQLCAFEILPKNNNNVSPEIGNCFHICVPPSNWPTEIISLSLFKWRAIITPIYLYIFFYDLITFIYYIS
jgi:hypothetical protein